MDWWKKGRKDKITKSNSSNSSANTHTHTHTVVNKADHKSKVSSWVHNPNMSGILTGYLELFISWAEISKEQRQQAGFCSINYFPRHCKQSIFTPYSNRALWQQFKMSLEETDELFPAKMSTCVSVCELLLPEVVPWACWERINFLMSLSVACVYRDNA